MRNRLEDLGRIAVMLEKMLDDEFWSNPIRPKDYWDWFSSLNATQQHDIIHKMVYGIRNIGEELHTILLIAEGQDRLNQTD